MNRETKSKLGRGLGVLTLAVGLSLAGLHSANATTSAASPGAMKRQCADDWADAPAGGYCSSARVRYGAPTGDELLGSCSISASCSVTFQYSPSTSGSTATAVAPRNITLTPSLSMTVTSGQADDIDICIEKSTNSEGVVSFSATPRLSCNTGESTAAEAVGGAFVANNTSVAD